MKSLLKKNGDNNKFITSRIGKGLYLNNKSIINFEINQFMDVKKENIALVKIQQMLIKSKGNGIVNY